MQSEKKTWYINFLWFFLLSSRLKLTCDYKKWPIINFPWSTISQADSYTKKVHHLPKYTLESKKKLINLLDCMNVFQVLNDLSLCTWSAIATLSVIEFPYWFMPHRLSVWLQNIPKAARFPLFLLFLSGGRWIMDIIASFINSIFCLE